MVAVTLLEYWLPILAWFFALPPIKSYHSSVIPPRVALALPLTVIQRLARAAFKEARAASFSKSAILIAGLVSKARTIASCIFICTTGASATA